MIWQTLINSSKDFIDYARKVDSLNEGYMPYMSYLFVFKHKNGKAWELEENEGIKLKIKNK